MELVKLSSLVVLCLELELLLVSCIYLPLNEVEVTVPVIKGEVLRRDLPLVAFKCLTDNNEDCKDVKFRTNSSDSEGLRISEDGEVFLTPEITKRATDRPWNFHVEITTASGQATMADMTVRALPLDELDCDELVREVCFWKSATYRSSGSSEAPTILGTVASPYLTQLCAGYRLDYEIVTGKNVVELVRPTRPGPWSLTRLVPISESAVVELSCSIEESEGPRAGTRRSVNSRFEVERYEAVRLPIRTQEAEARYYFNSRTVRKGLNLEPPIIFFDDNPDSGTTEYRPTVVGENRIRPDCKRWNLTTEHAKTAVHCRLTFKEDVTFKSSRKNFYLRLVSSTDSRVEAKIPIRLLFDIAPETLTRRSQKLFPNSLVKIFRTAGPLARVAQPTTCKTCHSFTLTDTTEGAVKMVFNITDDEGIIFVHDFVELRRAPEYVDLNVSWSDGGRRDFDEVQLRIVDEPNQTCANVRKLRDWTFCAEQETSRECERTNLCAVATGGVNYFDIRNIKGFPHRCMWRGDDNSPNITHAYSTCTPDIKTCPDGVCDSLEMLNELICPQDCTTKPLVPLKVNPKTGRGIDSASGTVICFNTNTCTLIPSQPKKQPRAKLKPRSNLTDPTGQFNSEKYTGFYVGDCGPLCMLGIATGLVLLAAGAAVTMLAWRRNRKAKVPRDKFPDGEGRELVEGRRQELDELSSLPLSFRMTPPGDPDRFKRLEDPKWEFPRERLVIEQTLGEGEFGRVLKAKATDIRKRRGFTTVAVKTLKDDARDSELNDLLSEYKLLKEVSHQNVIGLLGVCTTPGGPIYVIIEYAEYGSLRNYLRRSRKLYQDTTTVNTNYYDEPKTSEVTSKDILSFAWQVCNGMAYLSDIKLVHRDLAARNVLLTAEKVCKISDFGLTRDIYEDNAYLKRSKGRVPVKWMAPESLSDHIYTSKSDVWSFGVLIWELVTLGATPYPGVAIQNLFHLLKQGYRMERPDNCSPGLYKIMRSCWDIDPEKRPSFQELLKCWEELLEDKMEYMNLSSSAVVNRGYFMASFGQSQEIPEEEEEEEEQGEDSEDTNLNDQSKSGSEEKIQKVQTTIEGMLKGEATGYETPVKIQKVHDVGYTDMSGNDAAQ